MQRQLRLVDDIIEITQSKTEISFDIAVFNYTQRITLTDSDLHRPALCFCFAVLIIPSINTYAAKLYFILKWKYYLNSLQLSEQLSAVDSKCNSLNAVMKHAWGRGIYCTALNAGDRWIGEERREEAESNGRERGQSNKSKAILLTLPDCPTYPVRHRQD